jgi:hypothetical protein
LLTWARTGVLLPNAEGKSFAGINGRQKLSFYTKALKTRQLPSMG